MIKQAAFTQAVMNKLFSLSYIQLICLFQCPYFKDAELNVEAYHAFIIKFVFVYVCVFKIVWVCDAIILPGHFLTFACLNPSAVKLVCSAHQVAVSMLTSRYVCNTVHSCLNRVSFSPFCCFKML